MEEVKKKCPYCGEEIMAVAKKCKHCGSWLTKDKIEAITANSNDDKEERTNVDSEKSQPKSKGIKHKRRYGKLKLILIPLLVIGIVFLGMLIYNLFLFEPTMKDVDDKFKEKDHETAILYLTSMAESGDVQAQKRLAKYYEGDKGWHRDLAKSFKWYKECADNGDKTSQFRVAIYYLQGELVKRDTNIAQMYIKKCSFNDEERVCEIAMFLEEVLIVQKERTDLDTKYNKRLYEMRGESEEELNKVQLDYLDEWAASEEKALPALNQISNLKEHLNEADMKIIDEVLNDMIIKY